MNNHPDLAADLVDDVQEQTKILTDKSHEIIRNCVGYHYGPWGTKKWKKNIMTYSAEEMCVYTADYVANKRFVSVNYRRGNNGGL